MSNTIEVPKANTGGPMPKSHGKGITELKAQVDSPKGGKAESKKE